MHRNEKADTEIAERREIPEKKG